MNKAAAVTFFVLGLFGGIFTGALISGPADTAMQVGDIVKTGVSIVQNQQ